MKKITRKTPQSVKTQRKIDAVINDVAAEKDQYYKNLIHTQQTRHNNEIEQLKKIGVPVLGLSEAQKKSLLPVRDPKNGLLIPNANQGWKLFSNIAFASIIGTQAFFANLDPEVIAALPDNIQYYVTAFQAVIGIAARLINQTKRKGVANV
ncbi:hypothetical protein [Acinetobacter junii]|uniref:DUF7940 domain-containing protein n=1 Tax=Acinetobacter junii TaxID=40215 RepID=UPI00100FFCE4|nr:hypothetical protein [Acinetobacter junii]RXS99016.1 hypothetical protein ETZ13_04360 [Acinetobacter junii]